MAMKPKKIISSRGESGVGAGPGRGSSGGGGGATFRKKISENVTVKIKKKTADKVEKDMADLRKTFGRKTINSPAKTKAETRALKAAQGPSLAKGKRKLEAASGSVDRAIVKMKAQDNMVLKDSKKVAYAKSAKAMDKARANKPKKSGK
jgi:hypothetical protein